MGLDQSETAKPYSHRIHRIEVDTCSRRVKAGIQNMAKLVSESSKSTLFDPSDNNLSTRDLGFKRKFKREENEQGIGFEIGATIKFVGHLAEIIMR